MDRKGMTSIIALAAATVVFMGAVHMKAPASRYENKNAIEGKEEALEVSGAENIRKAVKVLNSDGSEAGYIVTVEEEGFGGTIVMEVAIDNTKTRVLSINVTDQNETPELGGKITGDEFRSQFADVEAPVYLPGMLVSSGSSAAASGALVLTDGSYKKEAADGDYTNVVTMTVSGGAITEITVDAVGADGNGKCLLSEQGIYVMTEDGLLWKEQAEALAAAIIDNQSTGFLNINDQGKTDAVSGVSIAVGGFVNLLEDLMEEAAGVASEESEPAVPDQGTVVDAISGATISSTAAVNAVNRAVEFLNQL